jgi:PAS domain S-box-containing protein
MKIENISRLAKEISLQDFKDIFEGKFVGGTFSHGVICQSGNGKIISANTTAKRVLGNNIDIFLGNEKPTSSFKIILESGEQYSTNNLPSQIVFRTKKTVSRTVVGILKETSKVHWYQIVSIPKFDLDHNDIKFVITIFKDITEEENTKRKLKERIKELNAFYAISEYTQMDTKPLEVILKKIVNMLPKSWQFPAIACCRLEINGREYKSKNYQKPKMAQSAKIFVNNIISGTLEIGYLEKRTDESGETFLPEEKRLLDSIAERIGKIIEGRKNADENKQEFEFNEMANRTFNLGKWRYNIPVDKIDLDENARVHFGISKDVIGSKEFLSMIFQEDRHYFEKIFRPPKVPPENLESEFNCRIIHPGHVSALLSIRAKIEYSKTTSGLLPLCVFGISQDITEANNSIQIVQKKTRELLMLSDVNQTLLERTNELSLLHEICRICTDNGGYRMAWAGYLDNSQARIIHPVAQSNLIDANFFSKSISWSDADTNILPTGTAVRTNRPCIAQNILQDARYASLREHAKKYGYSSIIALPIKTGWNTIGVISLYSEESDAFEQSEVDLLTKLVNNLSFGIETLRTREYQQNLEKKLRRSEERYKLAQQSAHIGSWEWDVQSNEMHWSDEMYILFEKTPTDFTPTYTSLMKCILSEDRFLTASAFDDSLDTEKPFDIEFRIKDTRGNIKWINAKGNALCKAANHTSMVSGTMQDITQRKQVEEALLQSTRNYRLISEYTSDVIWVMDANTERFAYISPSAKKLLGFTSDEMLQLPLVDVLTPDSYKKIKAILVTSNPNYAHGKPAPSVILELDQIRRNKSVVPTEVTITQIIDEKGTFQVIAISRDISKRKKAEEGLREERNLFQILMDNIPDGIYFKNKKSRFIRINQALARVLRIIDPMQAIGKTDFNFFSAEHAQQAFDDEQEIIKTGQPLINIEEKETWADGSERWVSTSKLLLRNSAGEIIGTFGISHDMTNRKLTEISLQQRIKELETVYQVSNQIRTAETVQQLLEILLKETLKTINAVDGGIFLYDPSTNRLILSTTFGWFNQLAGLTLAPDEGVNGHVFSTRKPYITFEMHDDQYVALKVKDLIPTHQIGGFFPIDSNEGTIGVLDVYVPSPRKLSENDQRLLAIISQMAGNAIMHSRLTEKIKQSNLDLQEEINQRIVFQSLLAAEKELLSTTLMSIGEGVIITDKDGMIVLLNRSAEMITGLDIQDPIDKPVDQVFQLVDPISDNLIPEQIQYGHHIDIFQVLQLKQKTYRFLKRTGEKILLAVSISPLKSPEGEMMGYVIVFQDITEKQKVEAQTALSQKMEAIGQLAAGIAHEINTPIQYIGDNLIFLKKTIDKFSEIIELCQGSKNKAGQVINEENIAHLQEAARQSKLQHYISESPGAVQEALDGVERVRKIVLAMREFSHPSEKDKKLSDLNHGIETTVVISRNEWKYSASLETDLDPDLPLINCQIDEINQVILNMIINAVQAIQEKLPPGSEQKGKITITTRKGEKCVIIKITDTGNGIPVEIRQRIFDPFFTTKGIGKGTGQGLSLAHQIIVQKHHGKIDVDSIVGEGTTFTIEIPISTGGNNQDDEKKA